MTGFSCGVLLNLLNASYNNSILSPSSGKTIQLHIPACLPAPILPDILCLIYKLYSLVQVTQRCLQCKRNKFASGTLVSCGGIRESFSSFQNCFKDFCLLVRRNLPPEDLLELTGTIYLSQPRPFFFCFAANLSYNTVSL